MAATLHAAWLFTIDDHAAIVEIEMVMDPARLGGLVVTFDRHH